MVIRISFFQNIPSLLLPFYYRFILSLCVPMTQVLLHSIIDDVGGKDSKDSRIGQVTNEKWWKKVSVWITIARVGLPVTYMLAALVIIMPGILYIY